MVLYRHSLGCSRTITKVTSKSLISGQLTNQIIVGKSIMFQEFLKCETNWQNAVRKIVPIDAQLRVATNLQFVKTVNLWSTVKWSLIKQGMPVFLKIIISCVCPSE